MYGAGKRNRYTTAVVEYGTGNATSQGHSQLREAIRQYEALLESSLSKLASSKERQDANAVLDRLRAADRALSAAGTGTDALSPKPETCAAGSDALALSQPLLQTERFLGEISDVRFFNLAKQVFLGRLGSVDRSESVDSYELDGDIPSPSIPPTRGINLPSPEKVKTFTDVYFSTVHLAFPFIPQAPFMKSLEQAMNPIDSRSLPNASLALICTLFTMDCDSELQYFKLTLKQTSYAPLERTTRVSLVLKRKTQPMRSTTCRRYR